jgi:UDP-glucuronate 4-epimerase
MRFFTVYGPAQRPEMAISLFTRSILEGTPVEVFGDGSSQRDYTYIDDIVAGLVACLPVLRGFEIINLGESQTISLSALIKLIEKACEKKAVLIRKSKQAGDVDCTFADIHKARELLGYHPKIRIDEGVKHYVNWFIKNHQG